MNEIATRLLLVEDNVADARRVQELLADEALAQQALRAGAQAYFLKMNMSGAGLARALRYAIVRRELERELGMPLQLTQRLQTLSRATEGVVGTLEHCIDELLQMVRAERERATPESRDRLEVMVDLTLRVQTLARELGLGSEPPAREDGA